MKDDYVNKSQRERTNRRCCVTGRREFITDVGMGFTGLALSAMLQQDGFSSETGDWRPPDGRPHFKPRAKNVIWLFMRGGVSHLESFDPKPVLNKYAGEPIVETPFRDVQDPERLKNVRVVVVNDANGLQRNKIYPLQVGYRRHGQSGIEISDWFPHIGGCVDDIAVVRSMWTTDNNHTGQVQFHSGRHLLDGRFPTIGAWVNYGLGSLNDDLPQFISMGPRIFERRDGHYLGPEYDAVDLKIDPEAPLPFGRPELDLSHEEQVIEFGLINRLNRLSTVRYPDDAALRARIKSYELAFRMQTAVPDAIAFDEENESTKELYGLNDKTTREFGMQLLAARRFVEKGVRFVQIMHGGGGSGIWDAHENLKRDHETAATQVDKPIAGLLKDLKARGMLDETIVLFGTEFGRTPGSQNGNGRDHHPFAFSVWMAGGGIQGGVAHGSSDDIGFHAEESPHFVTDLHATVHHLLGLDPRRLEVPGHKRLEIEFGNPIREILS